MTRWKGQARGGVTGHRIFISILRNLGLAPAYFLLRFVTVYFCLFSKGSSKHTYFYYHQVQGYSPLKSLFSIYRNYYSFGQTLVDKFALLSGAAADKFTYEHEGGENLQQMMDEGKGGILISAHLGNWDIAGHLLKRLKGRVNVLMFENEHEQIKAYLEPILGKRSFNVIVIRDDMSHLLEIKKALAQGEFICIHADRYLEGSKTIKVDLMGKEARLPVGPFMLATRFNAPVSFVFANKDNSRHYHFFSTPIKRFGYQRGQKAEDSVRPAVEAYTDTLEDFMKKYPHQWFNFFPYWEEEKEVT